jgi:hypothetical protein
VTPLSVEACLRTAHHTTQYNLQLARNHLHQAAFRLAALEPNSAQAHEEAAAQFTAALAAERAAHAALTAQTVNKLSIITSTK